MYRYMFGAYGKAVHNTCITFVSKISLDIGTVQAYGLQKQLLPVKNCRNIGKKDLIHNNSTPQIDVDPETYEVKVDGQHITCAPADVLPLAQRYFLF